MEEMSLCNNKSTRFYLMNCQYHQHYFFSCACVFCTNMFGMSQAGMLEQESPVMSGTWKIAVDEWDSLPQRVCFDFPSKNVRYNLTPYLQGSAVA